MRRRRQRHFPRQRRKPPTEEPLVLIRPPLRVHELTEQGLMAIPGIDRLGRRDLRRVMTGVAGFSHMASWGVRVRRVPGPYWGLDGVRAIVACPCGETPAVVALEPAVGCVCGRHFFFDGSDVWAMATPSSGEPAVSEPEPES